MRCPPLRFSVSVCGIFAFNLEGAHSSAVLFFAHVPRWLFPVRMIETRWLADLSESRTSTREKVLHSTLAHSLSFTNIFQREAGRAILVTLPVAVPFSVQDCLWHALLLSIYSYRLDERGCSVIKRVDISIFSSPTCHSQKISQFFALFQT